MSHSGKWAPAHTILGEDFVSPEEISDVRNYPYAEKAIAALVADMPVPEVVELMKERGFVLAPSWQGALHVRNTCIPRFPDDLSSLPLFSNLTGQARARARNRAPQWIALKVGGLQNSGGQSMHEQMQLLSRGEFIPNASQVSWTVTTFKACRDIDITGGHNLRTPSAGGDVCGEVKHVSLGDSGEVHIDDYWEGAKMTNVFLAVAMRW